MIHTINFRSTAMVVTLAIICLTSACNLPMNNPTPASTNAIDLGVQPTVEPFDAIPTQAPVESTGQNGASVTVDISDLAQEVDSQVVPAVPPSKDRPWWETMPQTTLLTLQGYPITDHLMKPQIFVYPVNDLGVNEYAGKVAEKLPALLQDQQVGESMPYLPPYNAAQVMHAQVKFLDFKNGKGVRFLTEFDQAPLPINNHELLYTYQGLTNDGKYYMAVVLPVNLSGLPADEVVSGDQLPDFMDNFPKYMTDTVDMLNQQPAGAYTPDLSQLDAMVQSMEIK